MKLKNECTSVLMALILGSFCGTGALNAGKGKSSKKDHDGLPSHADVKTALQDVVAGGDNGGFGLHMWVTIVNRDGEVCIRLFCLGAAGIV